MKCKCCGKRLVNDTKTNEVLENMCTPCFLNKKVKKFKN
ncbi:MAG: hypothetical protein RLZZ577_51 [Bacteroidota bacterium]|jgi:hypothetical protein